MKRSCRACRGRKKYWGAGMMNEYDCLPCNGTGVEEYDPSVQEKIEQALGVMVEEPIVEKNRARPAPKTFPVEPIMKPTVAKKSTKKK